MIKNNFFYKGFLGFLLLLINMLFVVSCKKWVEAPPQSNTINSKNVFLSDGTAISASTALISSLDAGENLSVAYLHTHGGLLADELTLFNQNMSINSFYSNSLLNLASDGSNTWATTYNRIYWANSIIEGCENNSVLSVAVRKQVLGEAIFMRAVYHFYLVNLFGRVPIVTVTDPEITRLLSRSSTASVYDQVIKDLVEARDLLSDNFLAGTLVTSTTDRVRLTRWAALAMLSRAYLYAGKYNEAIDAANQVIATTAKFKLNTLNTAFLKNSDETIWALQPIRKSNFSNTQEGALFIIPSVGLNNENPVYLSSYLMNAFEQGDDRKINWTAPFDNNGTTAYYAYKYKANATQSSVTEYEVVLRLAEQYLIRAEAKARTNDLAGAMADLNIIRTRARAAATASVPNPLPNLSGLNQQQLYAAIEHERQVELFTEWGHRWLDLKRTPGFSNPSITRADEIMPAITQAKSGAWSPNAKLYPIPNEQLIANPNMTNDQNAGY